MSATIVRQIVTAGVMLIALCACVAEQRAEQALEIDQQVLAAIHEPGPPPAPFLLGGRIAPGVNVPDPDLWREIRRGMTLEHHLHERRVQQEMSWLERHPDYLRHMQPRLERYLAYIHTEVANRGMPSELALLPIVESALDPYAFSHGGAAGLWQFIPATARRFGLDRNWWYDGRRDPVAATDAALDYLANLHDRFDNWYLALAGYNAGEGNVLRALRRAPADASFWELKLPRETSAYVPRLLALAALIDQPDAHGVTLPPVSPEVPFQVVDTGSQTDLSVIASATGIDIDTLYQWNPALNQWSTPPAGPNQVLLPVAESPDAAEQIAAIAPDERVHWLRITVKPGDTLSQLAHHHRTDVTSLKRANHIRGSSITVGQSLLIPKSPEALANPVAGRSQGSTYVVRSGDSLWTISRAHNVPMNRLMKANHVGPKDYLRVGQKLTVPGSFAATPTGGGREAVIRKVRYGVRRGDSLDRIARKFNVRVGDIVSWNKLNVRDYLQPGQTLLLYVDTTSGD